MSAGPAVLRVTVHQYRRLYLAATVYMVLLCGVGLLPSGVLSPAAAALLGTPFAGVLLMSMVAFINPDADLAGPGSHYPPFLLRLPVRTTTLALWPMVAGSLWSGLSWVLFTTLYLRARGFSMPVLWPALMLMSIVLCMQALMWNPFRFGNLRLVLILAIPTALIISGVWMGETHTPEATMAGFYGLATVIGAAGAWIGIVRARTAPSMGAIAARERAEPKPSKQKANVLARSATKTPAPFRSPLSAQVWMEWRQQGRILPIITTVIMLLASLPLLWEKDLALVPEFGIEMRPWIIGMMGALPAVVVLFAAVVGMGARRPNMRNGDGAYHLFYATRPLRSADILRAKVRAFSIGTFVSWGIVLATMSLWLALPARQDDATAPAIVFLWPQLARIAPLVLASLTGLVALTWRNQLIGAFVDYAPARWIVVGYPLLVTSCGALIFAGTTSGGLRELSNVRIAEGLLAAAIVLKLALAGIAAYGIVRLCPEDRREVGRIFAFWLAGFAGAASLLVWITQRVCPDLPVGQAPVPILLAAALTPLARPLFARYCLEIGRHR